MGKNLDWQTLLIFCASTFTGGMILFKLLLYLANSDFRIKKYVHIPARKSSTNAIQFGGLPLSLAIWLCCFAMIKMKLAPDHWHDVVKIFLTTSPLVIIYGYLDDKYEIRPIFKLFFQFTVVLWASLSYAGQAHQENTALFFLATSFVGMGVLNGANLLDGLDTQTIKLHTVSFLFFIALGFYAQDTFLIVLACSLLSALWSFYPFNKEPAKIHLGEIGGPFLGFSQLMLACGLFINLKKMGLSSNINSYTLAILPLTLPMIELSVSFLRRLYNKKSPFAGDKLHIHHLLCHYFRYSPSKASSMMGAAYLSASVMSFVMLFLSVPYSAIFIIQLAVQSGAYLAIGKKHWKGSDTLEISAKSLFDYIRKKDVTILEASIFDDFEFQILDEKEVQHKLHDSEKTAHDDEKVKEPSDPSKIKTDSEAA
jgi:UDP-N-acetylmuramyl pentapeptide phosphotransferase/UDP-N-acetylglucosamine-1-phosphate transferase